jgi:predicted acylesterase/phospholipase RssA
VTVMPHRECDLVMKGGITSGVVYAGAIVELAREFRLRSVGGTSAGAIGAAVAAAAEYARSRDRRPDMTDRLQPLIEDLTTPGHFAALLQPFRAGRPALAVMLALLRQERGPVLRGLAALWRVVWARWWLPVLTAATAAWAVWGLLGQERLSGPATAALVTLVVLVALVAATVLPAALLARAVWKGLGRPEDRFGLCSGISTGSRPALTDWLHTTIQGIAGLPESEPLTFAHLDEAQIELVMISTDLASARPVRLPLDRWGQTGWWYDPDELEGLFPPPVCAYLKDLPGELDEQGLRRLPDRELPVIVALRMSLSVPLLLACVPLYPAVRGSRPSRAQRSWFTDGGVTSNFPIHFFDAWLPRRPTFGIDLVPVASPDVPRIHLPGLDEPPAPRWEDVDGPVALVRQVVDSAQNWRDTAQAELPGYRDRICQVRLYPGEGGLHVNMPPAGIQELIDAGAAAGRAFVQDFDDQRLLGHQVGRYLVLARQLQDNLDELRPTFDLLSPTLNAGLPANPAYDPPFERRTLTAMWHLLWAAAISPQPRGVDVSPPPVIRIGPRA